MNKTNCQRTALESAAKNGHDECVQMLIQTGMHEQIYYKYAFNKAMAFKHENITGMLVEALGYENIPEDYLMIALLHGTEGGNQYCADLLKDHLATGLEAAVHKDFPKSLKVIMEAGADVNALYHGMTALTRAALRPHPSSCLGILLQAGGDVNQLDNFGVTALMRAASRVNDNIVALIKAGADVNIMSPKLGTALFTAAKSKFVINTRTLLRAGIRINQVNQFRNNALQNYLRMRIIFIRFAMCKLLFVAGETLDVAHLNKPKMKINRNFRDRPEVNLKHLCRRAVRKHLLDLNPHIHLFHRVPQLELPFILTDYLLYNLSLSEEHDHSDGDDIDVGDNDCEVMRQLMKLSGIRSSSYKNQE